MNPNQTLHTRREFLRTSMLGAAATLTLPVFLQKTFAALDAESASSPILTATGKDGPILVILQLAGGNDGLNTVIPFADDAYYRARPVIGIPSQNVLKINDYLGLHPKLGGLKGLYDSGHLAIVQGVGYPNPNRSHFRSTEIWQTASDADAVEKYGWIGRYFDNCCKGADPTVGVAISPGMPQAFVAKTPTGISFQRPDQYKWQAGGKDTDVDNAFHHLNQPAQDESGSSIGMVGNVNTSDLNPLDYLQRTALDAQLSSQEVLEISRKYKSSVEYPKNGLAGSLSLVAKMIAGGLPTRIYYASQGGYDTHNNQLGTHDRLMSELGDTLAAFAKDLQQQGNFKRVTLMTFSEFGRRVVQNGSNGTDHGAASPMFIMGGAIKAGLYGKYPSLTDLHDNDLIFNTDFRSVYATLLDHWLKAPSKTILGRQFPTLSMV